MSVHIRNFILNKIQKNPELFETKESRSEFYKKTAKQFKTTWQTIVGIYCGINKTNNFNKTKKTIPKILFVDIETSPNIGLFWEAGYKKNIDYSNIIKERAIITICCKWKGIDTVYSFNWDENQDDKQALISFSKLYNQADVVIGHNGDRFDIPWIKTRLMYHKLPQLSQTPTQDTLLSSRNKLKFNSNRLDYIAQYLGVGAKIKTTFNLWKDILLLNCKDSLKEMVDYCKEDVRILEKVWERMQGVLTPKIHAGVLAGKTKCSCNNCSGENISLDKVRTTAVGTLRYQMICNDCKNYFTISKNTYELFK